MTNEQLINEAKTVVKPVDIGNFGANAGGVGCALQSGSGKMYYGVCLDSNSGLGFCAERTAIAQMITHGEYKVHKIVAVMFDPDSNQWQVLPPCGACREFMKNLTEDFKSIEVVLTVDQSLPLEKLLP